MLHILKAAAVYTLLFERSDPELDHPVLLWDVGRDELMLQSVAFDQGCVAAVGEHQTVVRPAQEWLSDPAQTPLTGDQGPFALGRPAFNVVFHPCAHLCFLQR